MRDPRPAAYAALFGALWGAIELSLGTVLNLGRVPFYGVLMCLLGLLCLVTLRRLQPRIGVCLLAGMVAIFLKVFAMGGLRPGPLLGIALQAVVVEATFTLLGCRRISAMIGGGIAVATAPAQYVIGLWLFAGAEALTAYVETVEAGLARLGLSPLSGSVMLVLLLLVSGAIGAAGGLGSWRVAERVAHRLGRRQ
jgi:hypothetical protein